MKSERTKEGDQVLDRLIAPHGLVAETREDGTFVVEIHRRPLIIRALENGWDVTSRMLREAKLSPRELLERFAFANLVTDQGLNHKRGTVLLGATQITTWYVLLTDGTPTIVAADTYASHAGWAEETNYDEATRETWTGAATGTAGEASNAAAVAEFTISTGGATVGGAGFVGGGSAPSTKGDTAGGGTLLSASAFSGGDRALLEDDLLRITYIQRSSRP